jgi:hypothetical protein
MNTAGVAKDIGMDSGAMMMPGENRAMEKGIQRNTSAQFTGKLDTRRIRG